MNRWLLRRCFGVEKAEIAAFVALKFSRGLEEPDRTNDAIVPEVVSPVGLGQSVPEPEALTFLAMGMLGLLCPRRRKAHSIDRGGS